MKQRFLINYDYGMGAVWAIITAHTRQEIESRFPDITVVDTRPPWMTDDQLERIASTLSLDIDDKPRGWLAELRTRI
jgi:hypothetical protein